MKHYIILTGSISNMGGAEMFTSNKVSYLTNLGWSVQVFYFNKGGNILLQNLRQYENNYIPELKYGYYFWSKQQRKNIINVVCKNIKPNTFVVVESHIMGLTYWGEMIAESIRGVHIVNCLEEYIRQVTASEAAFLEYKLRRKEVLNGTPRSYRRYFGKLYKKEYDTYSNTMIPLCSNVVSETSDIPISIPNADFSLLSIGRLDKPYIQTMLKGVYDFVCLHKDKTFNLLLVGASSNGDIERQILELFREISNINIVEFGYMYPIPVKLLNCVDVALASANSVLVSANMGIPTIAFDMADYQAIGVFGYDTNNRFRRQEEPVVYTEDLLEDILFSDKYSGHREQTNMTTDLDSVFGPQVDFIYNTPLDRNSYDVMSIHSKFRVLWANIKRIIYVKIGKFKISIM